METTTLIIIGGLVILASLLWRFRIRRSKLRDLDYQRQHDILVKAREANKNS